MGSRVVEVVHLPPRGTSATKEQAGRSGAKVRAQTWEDGFPTRAVPAQSPPQEPVAAEKIEPVAHVMPVRQPVIAQPATTPPHTPPEAAQTAEPRPARRARPTARRIADPFDETDDGANCFRCGYLIEPARERRGLMTCAECG